jgi:aminoglycoside phosphotransferase (APT) family kinase protein
MAREYRMLASVNGIYDLAPSPILYCEDPTIMGGAFLLMQRIPGTIIRGPVEGEEPAVMIARLEQLIDAMAVLHSLELGEEHLSLGRPDGYRRRQVEGWRRRFDAAGAELPLGFAIGSWLEANLPETPEGVSFVHNDFKLDNLVWSKSDPTRLVGVLDWEMATIGDPLLDLACTLSFWVEAGDPAPLRALRAMPSAGQGYPTRNDALQRYAQRTNSSIEDFKFYRCFGLFRRAVIEQQKFHRFRSGQTTDPRFAELDRAAATLLEACAQAIA